MFVRKLTTTGIGSVLLVALCLAGIARPLGAAAAATATTVTATVSTYDDDLYQDGTAITNDSKTVWIGDDNSTTSSYAGLRFGTVAVPRGATITGASLRFYSTGADATNLKVNIYGDASGNSGKFSTASLPSARALTAAYTNYASPAAWALNTWYAVDVTTVVKEITARSDWNNGNALSLIVKGISGSQGARRAVKGYASWDSTNVPQLVVNYGTTATATPTSIAPTATKVPPTATAVPPTATRTTVPPTATTVPPSATATPATVTASTSTYDDDLYQDGTAITNDSKTVWIGDDNSTTSSYAGLRFGTVAVPRGATITGASLRFYSTGADATNLKVNIYGDASGNSGKFSTASLPSARALTAAYTNYASPAAWALNTWYAVDVTTVVKEITARSDWNNGNALSLIVKGISGSQGARRAVKGYASWDSTNVPQLVVNYGGTGTSVTPTGTAIPPTSTATTVPPTGTVVPPTPPAQPNLVTNPGFESGLSGWDITVNSGSATVVTGAHSGSGALQITSSSATNIAATSNYFSVQPGQLVDASGWFKWQNVSGGSGLRMNLYAYDASHTRLKGWDLAAADGNAPSWKKMSSFVLVPPSTSYMQLRVQFTGASGTAWLDDVYVRIAQSVPAVNTSVSGPVIMPHPWQIRAGGTRPAMGNTGIVVPSGESRLSAAAGAYWNTTGLASTILAPGAATSGYATVLRFGDRNTPELAAAFSAKFPGNTWDQLGTQGYFLSVGQSGSQVQILAGANSEQGRFYALQSIKQIVKSGAIYTLDVLDSPSVARRGIVMSASRFGSYTSNLQKIAGYKMNFSWNQGTFESNKFNYDWRTALTSGEQSELRDYITQAANNFVTPWISLGPRASSATGNTTCYSCDADINLVVSKFNTLYSLGLRNFGLNFDDLSNVGQEVLIYAQDKTQFGNDIAQAHLYFITQVYNRLKAAHADINMMIVPLQCYSAGVYGTSQEHYLQVLGGLPAGVGIYSVQYYNEDYLRQMQLTGRPTTNWSNFYQEGWVPGGTYVVPDYNFFDSANQAVRGAMNGLTFLPVQPADEDAGLISWTTTADYFWAPERYDPNQSFQWGAAKYLGK